MAAGRPKIEWGDKEKSVFESLCRIQCTQDEICAVMEITDKTLNKVLRRVYKMNFSDCFKKFSASG